MKRICTLLLSLLLLAACAAPQEDAVDGDSPLVVVATTYPVYLFASDVARDVEGVTVTPMINQAVSCLHDYTLTMDDMKALEGADLILLNGAGLEDFMTDALAIATAPVADCSAGVDLLASDGHDHDHAGDDGDHDPHLWLDPARAAQMVSAIQTALSALDPAHESNYAANAASAQAALQEAGEAISRQLAPLETREIITFHDGFAYFADAFDLTILMAIEEEEGAEASAQEIAQVVSLVNGHSLAAIFTEVNGSDASAQAISRETGAAVYPLTLIMSGPTQEAGVADYVAALQANADTLMEALG